MRSPDVVRAHGTRPQVGGPLVSVTDVEVTFASRDGSETNALGKVSVDVHEGEFVAIIGPSGCGKTTLLNAIAGFVTASKGSIEFDGASVTAPSWERGVVFQDHALFPWLTVADNVKFGPQSRGLSRDTQNDRVEHYLGLVGLTEFARKYPHELSGGMKQRAGIARVLANEPKLLLMDEPFGALDALTREQLQAELLRIWLTERKTIIFVTHGVDEAIFLADRILVMSARPGRFVDEFRVTFPRPRQREGADFNAIAMAVRAKLDRDGHR